MPEGIDDRSRRPRGPCDRPGSRLRLPRVPLRLSALHPRHRVFYRAGRTVSGNTGRRGRGRVHSRGALSPRVTDGDEQRDNGHADRSRRSDNYHEQKNVHARIVAASEPFNTSPRWVPANIHQQHCVAPDALFLAALIGPSAAKQVSATSPKERPRGSLQGAFVLIGGVADGARTHDNRNHNPGLYQLSYSHRRADDYSGPDRAAGFTSRRRSRRLPQPRRRAVRWV